MFMISINRLWQVINVLVSFFPFIISQYIRQKKTLENAVDIEYVKLQKCIDM